MEAVIYKVVKVGAAIRQGTGVRGGVGGGEGFDTEPAACYKPALRLYVACIGFLFLCV